MAKPIEKNKALKLRHKGKSIKEIARQLHVVKSTVSLWCRDVELTPQQIQKLHERMVNLGYKGRMKGARMQYERRLKRITASKKKGLERLNKISDRDFLIAGLALYWGEGSKKNRRASISNSDPEIIKFMINWFRKIWRVKDNRFTLYVGINEIHKERVEEVEEYWSEITNIPRTQFNKTTLIKVKNKKNYKNFPVHYGTLTIRIKRPAEFYYKIMGLIDAMNELTAGE